MAAMYAVTWGDTTQAVYAETEQEAWNEFARGNDLANRHPNLFARTVAPYEDMQETTDPGVLN